MLNRQIQKEIWRIQDVMEGLRKNNPSRGTDTAKHRGDRGLSLGCPCWAPARGGEDYLVIILSLIISLLLLSLLQWPWAPRARTAPTAPPAP